jgi:SAM-dependent methyltransferase
MADAFDKLAFETAQMARIGWFFGQKLLAARLAKPVPVPDKLRGRKTPDRQRLLRDLWRLIEQDWQNIADGVYAAPEDWRGNPLDGLRRAADFFADLRAVEARRHGDPSERLLSEAPSDRYPRYYLRKFHFQTDGYLSEASAERYDHQVEVLFGGGAAAMRRQALVPLRSALLEREGGPNTARLLDLGCGTGGQVLLLAEMLPRARVVGIDVSAASIEAARAARAVHPAAERIELAVADYMAFAGGPFDVVVSDTVLYAIPVDTASLFAKLARDLVEGGLLVYTMPVASWYNRALGVVRRLARALRGRALDAIVLAAARALHGREWDEALLRERIPYMYVVPFRWDSAALHARMAERWGLPVVATEAVPHASPAQLQHCLVVARRRSAHR